jgi:putative nucleotidyltransferase with HDIG domain
MIEAMATVVLDTALELLPAESGAVFLLDHHQTFLRVSAARGAPEQWLGQLLPRQEGLPWRCLVAGRLYLTQPAGPGRPAAVEEVPIGQGTALWAPIRAGMIPLGVLALGLDRTMQCTEDARAFVERTSQVAGNALRRGMLMQGLQQAQLETVLALANAVNARDEYTGDHSKRLAPLAEATARRLGCSDDELEDIRWGAMLHDIGKIAVPDPILLKPGPLTEAEWAIVRRHPEQGEAIVRTVDALRRTATLIRHHQERFDGKGYPDALDGDRIPLGARILAVVDAYSAIRDRRPYKNPRTHNEAVAELRRCKGTQFDPRVVDTFLSVVEASPAGA